LLHFININSLSLQPLWRELNSTAQHQIQLVHINTHNTVELRFQLILYQISFLMTAVL